ncbi:Uncharacterized protein TCM_022523 [Theobroma cacao]|uniref:Reverse transcriptase zinc-binding domain-containing protein n=1 Tax=Theobroma cacao TaxID=3641 RepID=A0A061F126_THECC|nr:Uncharacterized protein TCM_022523 [Theobroma cacao]
MCFIIILNRMVIGIKFGWDCEIFCWQLIKGRIGVKDCLANKGITSDPTATCPLFKKEREKISQLFFLCDYTWPMWQWRGQLWNVDWISYTGLLICFLS